MSFLERILHSRILSRDEVHRLGPEIRQRLAVRIRAEEKFRSKGLTVGTEVVVQLDGGRLQHTTVRLAPWQLGHGQWVVGLEGISGGYDVKRVFPKEEIS